MPTQHTTFHPEKVSDAIEALTEAQDLLSVLETAMESFIERSGNADAEIAGTHLLRITRVRVQSAADVLLNIRSDL